MPLIIGNPLIDIDMEPHTQPHADTLAQSHSADPAPAQNPVSRWDGIVRAILMGLVFLLPVFLIPTLTAPFQFTKILLVFVAVIIALIVFIFARLQDGTVIVPRNLPLAGVWALPLAYLLSALFSSAVAFSLFGSQFETDTFGFIAVMAIFFTLTALVLREKAHFVRVYMALLSSGFVLGLYHLLRLLFGPEVLSFGVLDNQLLSPVGQWNNLAVFFGLLAILVLLALRGLKLTMLARVLLYVLLALSTLMLAVVNFFMAWLAVGIFAFGLFVHSISGHLFKWNRAAHGADSEQTGDGRGSISIGALAVLFFAGAFVFGGGALGNAVSSFFDINYIEARPSWQTTIDITRNVYAENALLGSGPNTFTEGWLRYKPTDVNETVFWNTDFNAGIGFIPTSFATTGILGMFAWLVFFGLLVYAGARALVISPVKDTVAYHLVLSSFLGSVFLWIMAVLYVPSIAVLSLAFLMSGVFAASLRYHSADTSLREKEISFAGSPRLGFVSILALTFLFLVSLVALYSVGERYLAAVTFQRALAAQALDNDLDRAAAGAVDAIALRGEDRYFRFLAEIGIVQLANILAEPLSENALVDEVRNRFQQTLGTTVEAALSATEAAPQDYRNWLVLARVYQAVVPVGIEGAYENAVRAYERAEELNPKAPILPLSRARLEIVRGNDAEARTQLERAIALKRNYTEAIFLLSQIQVREGNVPEAIRSVESAALLDPNNPLLFFQLGLLQYDQRNFDGTIGALERAVALNESYANARYFLGLAYAETGRPADAISQFERVQELNPDNQEVAVILENLRAGAPPLAGFGEEPPEDRDEPPIPEPEADIPDIEEITAPGDDADAGEGASEENNTADEEALVQ